MTFASTYTGANYKKERMTIKNTFFFKWVKVSLYFNEKKTIKIYKETHVIIIYFSFTEVCIVT